jgi:hypothetical protein
MTVAEMIRGLGGARVLSQAMGLTRTAVANWATNGEVPREHHITLWRMALAAGLPWEPPGADAIRHLLQAAPADRKVA